MRRKTIFAVLCFIIVISIGCSQTVKTVPSAAECKKISALEAKAAMDSEDCIILDVRSQGDYEKEHIGNAVLLPRTEIEADAESIIPDKDAKILIYCKTGLNSALAAEKLIEMGYTNVYDFGGIDDWPYETVK